MGCGNSFFVILVTLSVALITYNILISAKAPLKLELPGLSNSGPSSKISVDPIIKMPVERSPRQFGQRKRLFHTAVTASDSVYNTWQCRVMYYWFKKHKGGPNSEMGGFTRILHSGRADKFMDEIPTFVAQPLPSGLDQVSRITGGLFDLFSLLAVFGFAELRLDELTLMVSFNFDILYILGNLWCYIKSFPS